MGVTFTSLLLFDDGSNQSGSLLRDRLLKLGVSALHDVRHSNELETQVAETAPDILVVCVDALSAPVLEQLAEIHTKTPLPVIVFAETNVLEVVQTVVAAGVSSYVVGHVEDSRLPVTLNLAVERFKQINSLNTELAQVKERLSERKIIEKAKGIIMKQKHLSEDQAYAQMRSTAMNQGQSMAELGRRIVSVFELLE